MKQLNIFDYENNTIRVLTLVSGWREVTYEQALNWARSKYK